MRREQGQAVVEYAMVVGFVCLLVVGILATDAPNWISGTTTKIGTVIAAIS